MTEKPLVRPLTPRHVCTLALPSIIGKSSTGESSVDGNRNRLSSESTGSFHRKESSVSSFDTNVGDNVNISSNSSVASNSSKHSSRTTFTTNSSTTVPLRNTRNPPNVDHGSSTKASYTGVGFASPKSSKVGSPLIVAFGQYLLVPTLDAYILVYSITDFSPTRNGENSTLSRSYKRQDSSSRLYDEQQHLLRLERERMKCAVEPIRIVGPFYIHSDHGVGEYIPASIIDIACTPVHSIQQKQYAHEKDDYLQSLDCDETLLGHVAVVTKEGDVHILDVFHPITKEKDLDQEPPVLNRIISFSTGVMGTTCVTFTTPGTIAIGYESGRILCYHYDTVNRPNTVVREDWGWASSQPRMLWSAYFENAIHSLSFRGNLNELFPSTEEHEHPRGKNFLLVGLSIQNRRNSNMQPSLEVVDVDFIQDQWTALSMSPEKGFIQLENISLWPKPGTEVRDVDMVKVEKDLGDDVCVAYALAKYEGKSSRAEGIYDPTLSVDGIGTFFSSLSLMSDRVQLYSHDVHTEVPFHGLNAAFAASFSNGHVAIMNWFKDVNLHVQYGVIHYENQLVFAVPCIGIAAFDDSSLTECPPNSLVHRNCIVCCSRGGMVWVIPTIVPNKKAEEHEQKHIIMYQLPYDHLGEDDGQPRYIQGFTAGYVKTKSWRSSECSVLPLMFHAWSGGLIDVYSCDMAMDLSKVLE